MVVGSLQCFTLTENACDWRGWPPQAFSVSAFYQASSQALPLLLPVNGQAVAFTDIDTLVRSQGRAISEDEVHIAADFDSLANCNSFAHDVPAVAPRRTACLNIDAIVFLM